MEISASEIDLLCKRIRASITDYSLSGIYSIENGLLLRLRHSTKPEKLIAVASFATWLTTKNLALPEVSAFASRIRDHIERERLVSVEQVGNERIAKFYFKGRSETEHNLYTEFFAGGNQIVTDPENGDRIIDVARQQRFRHRILAQGENYVLPPSRGIPLSEVSFESLQRLIQDEKKVGNIDAIKWFGRSIGTSRKFVEEIFFRANLNPDISVSDLTTENLAAISIASRQVIDELQSSEIGYLLLPNENKAQPQIDSSDVGELEVDVCAIIPNAWKILEKNGMASVKQFESFSEALDEAQVQSLLFARKRKASIEVRSKAAELESAIRKQDLLLERNKQASSELRSFSLQIMSGDELEISDNLMQRLKSLDIIAPDDSARGKLRFTSDPRAFVSSYNPRSLASRLFDEAKHMEDDNRKIESIRADLSSQKEILEEQSAIQEERAERKLSIDRRSREWFERYRWFIASDGSLVVGGRDSTTNSVIINKYTDRKDYVFHADLHGSPFFVLKVSVPKDGVDDELAFEIAQATVSFSRAWKDELASADAYWVKAEQVKKSAPSGEYLPRGSFFIEGKKNFVKHVRVELAIGIMRASKLPQDQSNLGKSELDAGDDGDAESTESSNTKNDESILIVCGPEKSISNYAFANVKIAPGKEKASYIAKRIKQILVGKVKEPSLKEMSKRISIDEIIRSLPAGSYKLVSEKQNR